MPVNKVEAKGTIWRTVTHDHEVGAFINGDLARTGGDGENEGSASPARKASKMGGYAEKL